MSLQYNHDNSYLFVNGKEIYKIKADNKTVIFPTHFFLGSISNRFGSIDSRGISSKRDMYDFQLITMLLINLTH